VLTPRSQISICVTAIGLLIPSQKKYQGVNLPAI
jgi:hypothetical protein